MTLTNRLVYQTSRLHLQLQSHQQSRVAYLSMEAEYIVLSYYSKQVIWIHTIMEELGYFLESILICKDNQGSIIWLQKVTPNILISDSMASMTTLKKASLRYFTSKVLKILQIYLQRTWVKKLSTIADAN